MKLLTEKFVAVDRKLTVDRISEYPICVSYLRMLFCMVMTQQQMKKRDAIVSLTSHFEELICILVIVNNSNG